MSTGELDATWTDQPDSASRRDAAKPDPQDVADAVVLFMVTRDLVRIGREYPDAMPEADHKAWVEEVTEHAEAILERPGFDGIKILMKSPVVLETEPSAGFNMLMSTALMVHPAMAAPGRTQAEMQSSLEKVMGICQETASADAKQQMSRLADVMVLSCRFPTATGVKDFGDPARFLQMMNRYWRLASELVQIQSSNDVGFNPHPLLHIIENIRDRLRTCFTHLGHLEGADDVGQACDQLIGMLTEGDIDDLSAVPAWTNGEIQKVETFIARARLSVGGREYALTKPEVYFIRLCEQLIVDHGKRVQAAWKQVLADVDANAAKRRDTEVLTSSPPDNTPRTVNIGNWNEGGKTIVEAIKAVNASPLAPDLDAASGTDEPDPEPAGSVSKLDGWTRAELIDQANHDDGDGSKTLSSTTFDRIRENARIPAAEKGGVGAQRRFSVAQLRKLIDEAEVDTYRKGLKIAAMWRQLLPS